MESFFVNRHLGHNLCSLLFKIALPSCIAKGPGRKKFLLGRTKYVQYRTL
jgi:hypothetical protein